MIPVAALAAFFGASLDAHGARWVILAVLMAVCGLLALRELVRR